MDFFSHLISVVITFFVFSCQCQHYIDVPNPSSSTGGYACPTSVTSCTIRVTGSCQSECSKIEYHCPSGNECSECIISCDAAGSCFGAVIYSYSCATVDISSTGEFDNALQSSIINGPYRGDLNIDIIGGTDTFASATVVSNQTNDITIDISAPDATYIAAQSMIITAEDSIGNVLIQCNNNCANSKVYCPERSISISGEEDTDISCLFNCTQTIEALQSGYAIDCTGVELYTTDGTPKDGKLSYFICYFIFNKGARLIDTCYIIIHSQKKRIMARISCLKKLYTYTRCHTFIKKVRLYF